MLTKTQKEELRHAAREFLACRPKLAFTAEQAQRMMARRSTLDFSPEVADVEEAFFFLEGLRQASSITDELGSSVAWQITSAGTLAYERGA
ncbi:MAG: hypothetical protein NTV49_10810 [Kiritimatiellaeota bacterium]|nr:hypothetical protein [Kiritimatiellota bacterium]